MTKIKLNVNEQARNDANLRLLKRTVNKDITDIIGNYTATHVVLYFFRPKTQQWEKSLIEGSLSLVKVVSVDNNNDNTEKYLLIILNRNSPENYIMDFTKDFQLQQNNPYLIFKNYENKSKQSKDADADVDVADVADVAGQVATIRGIWFPNENEIPKMYDLLMNVLNELKNPSTATAVVAAVAPVAQAAPTQMNVDRNAATAALFASLNIGGSMSSSNANQQQQQQSQQSQQSQTQPTATAAARSSSATSTTSSQQQQQQSQQPTLDKKSLQLSLLSLIQDERFLDLIHAQYLKVHNARTNNNNRK